MTENPNQTTTRICEWCATEIPNKALKCPNCNKWRKDIEREIIMMYTFYVLAGALAGLAIGYNPVMSHSQETISTIKGWSYFLSLLFFIPGLYYNIKVSKKMGTYWWC